MTAVCVCHFYILAPNFNTSLTVLGVICLCSCKLKMPVLCVTCTRNITSERSPGIRCSNCNKTFHTRCVKISEELIKNINSGTATYLCPPCRSSSRRSVIDYNDPGTPDIPTDPTLHDVMVVLTTVQNKLSDLESSQQYISSIFDELNNRVSILVKENVAMKKKLIQFEQYMEEHENKISWLEANADIPYQNQVARNIVVCGLPSEVTDINELFINIIDKLSQKISRDDIINIEKMKHNNDGSTTLKNAYIITLKTQELKQTILTNFRRKKSLFMDEVDTKFNKTRIVMLHHFTKYQSKLYNETKKFKAHSNFRFLWCTNNKILLRKLPDSNVHHIRSSYDLIRLQRNLESAEEIISSE